MDRPERKQWYRLEGQRLVLQSETNRYWEPDILEACPFPDRDLPETLILEGKGAVWMYAHMAARATRAGVRSIFLRVPYREEPLQIHPPLEDTRELGWCQVTQSPSGDQYITFQTQPQEIVDPQEVLHLALPASQTVCLTGRGAVWMYAAAASRAVQQGAELVLVSSPREGRKSLVVFGEHPGQRLPPGPELGLLSTQGVLIGIVGDPNSGKSVLSHLLYKASQYIDDADSWLLDADGASPTPNWYLNMQRSHRAATGAELRAQQKLEWTDAMENSLAHQMRNLRESLDMTLVDLPGGKHPKPHHSWPAERIPPHREVMMEPIDTFLILARGGDGDQSRAIEEAWRTALKQHGLESRVGAVLVSSSPHAPLRCDLIDQGPLLRGHLCGLERKNVEEASEDIVKTLAQLLRSLVARGQAY